MTTDEANTIATNSIQARVGADVAAMLRRMVDEDDV